jgi:hypothetical protein
VALQKDLELSKYILTDYPHNNIIHTCLPGGDGAAGGPGCTSCKHLRYMYIYIYLHVCRVYIYIYIYISGVYVYICICMCIYINIPGVLIYVSMYIYLGATSHTYASTPEQDEEFFHYI